MSDETEDGPEVQEIYEKSTGYAIGHFPAHTVYVVDWDRGLEGGGFNVVLSDKVSIHKHAGGA